MPFGDIWEKYCELQGVPACDEEWFATVMKYEEEVQLKRA
jgi:L-rhamnose isomerase